MIEQTHTNIRVDTYEHEKAKKILISRKGGVEGR